MVQASLHIGAIVRITLDTCITVAKKHRFDFCRINSVVFLIFTTQIFASTLPQSDSAKILRRNVSNFRLKVGHHNV